ncbi:MAG: TauD/TfdA family dioxygenase, partial [Alphaproteobacteria bacterium]
MTVNPFSLSHGQREPAIVLRPVVDPAGWYPEDISSTEAWRYVLSDTEVAEIDDAVARVAAQGFDIVDIRRKDFPLPAFSAGIQALRKELQEGRGFVQIRGMPVEHWTKAQSAAAFWGIGTHLGRALSQNAKGDLLGHIKDLGGDYSDPMTRGYLTNARMGFHADQCDYVVLFCLQQAKSGGASRIASSVTVYNEMLKRFPELVPELIAPSHWTLHGEISPGEKPWYDLPVFNFRNGYFTAKGVSSHILKSQAVPGVPKYSARRLEAFERFREIAEQFSVRVDVQPGDINILHNHVVLHSRDSFEDWPEPERKRHLYRLWINDGVASRPMPGIFRENIQGIRVDGVRPRARV